MNILAVEMALRWKIAQWFELRWWQSYLRDKNKIVYLNWKRNYWQTVLNRITGQIKMDASKSVIDMGCGPSGIFIALPENKVTAVDPLLNEYESTTNIFKRSNYNNVNFVTSTIEDFQGDGLKYDYVFCMNAINHVHDIEKGFEKLIEVCNDNGAIIISIDAHNYSLFKYLFRSVPGDILHPHQYGLGEYKSFLEKQGWKIKSTFLLKHEFFFDHYLMVAKLL